MATTDSDTLHRLYDAITVGSKRFSGIVGDAKHAASGGYHIGRAFVPASDYSAGGSGRNTSPRDRGGSSVASCAIDVSFSTADMITVTKRLLAAAGTNAMRGVREFNGTANGRTTLNRDAVLGWRQNYTPDPTHLWHIHIGFFRDTAQDWDVIADVAAVINGVAVRPAADGASALDDSTTDTTPAPPVQEDDDMALLITDSDNKALFLLTGGVVHHLGSPNTVINTERVAPDFIVNTAETPAIWDNGDIARFMGVPVERIFD